MYIYKLYVMYIVDVRTLYRISLENISMYIHSTQMYIHVQCSLVVHVYGGISELSTCKFLLTQALPTGTLQPCSYHSFTTVHVAMCGM